MTTKFKTFKRYDDETANDGVFFNITDELGNEYGEFKCRYLDPHSPQTEVVMKRIRKKYAADIRSKKLSDMDAVRAVFVEGVLADWKGVLDANDKPVPFSLPVAIEFFNLEDNRWLLNELSELAGDVKNFQAQAEVEEVAKN